MVRISAIGGMVRRQCGYYGLIRGFTLIELLVVVAIISVLVAILLPALSRSRIQSQDVVCKSNLRSQGMLIMTYVADSGGAMPRSASHHIDVGSPRRYDWHSYVAVLSEHAGQAPGYNAMDFEPPCIWSCPRFEPAYPTEYYNNSQDEYKDVYSYAMNYYVSMEGDPLVGSRNSKEPVRIEDILYPSNTIAIADARLYPEIISRAMHLVIWYGTRHDGWTHTLMVDGSVSKDTVTSNNMWLMYYPFLTPTH